MIASRGMGAIAPSKMPSAKRKTRRDGDSFKQFGEGGEVNKDVKPYLEGQINSDKYGTGGGGKVGITKSLGKNSDVSAYIEGGGYKPKDSEFKGKITGGGVMYSKRFEEGGSVNEAGNYTKPSMRKALFNSIKNSAVQGTAAGQWSARKAQLLAKKYKEKGGGYKD
jgi:hypothetical protein